MEGSWALGFKVFGFTGFSVGFWGSGLGFYGLILRYGLYPFWGGMGPGAIYNSNYEIGCHLVITWAFPYLDEWEHPRVEWSIVGLYWTIFGNPPVRQLTCGLGPTF